MENRSNEKTTVLHLQATLRIAILKNRSNIATCGWLWRGAGGGTGTDPKEGGNEGM